MTHRPGYRTMVYLGWRPRGPRRRVIKWRCIGGLTWSRQVDVLLDCHHDLIVSLRRNAVPATATCYKCLPWIGLPYYRLDPETF